MSYKTRATSFIVIDCKKGSVCNSSNSQSDSKSSSSSSKNSSDDCLKQKNGDEVNKNPGNNNQFEQLIDDETSQDSCMEKVV